jgi:hypothetical protein
VNKADAAFGHDGSPRVAEHQLHYFTQNKGSAEWRRPIPKIETGDRYEIPQDVSSFAICRSVDERVFADQVAVDYDHAKNFDQVKTYS